MKTTSATHILVEPDLSGWHYVTTIEEQDDEIRRGHDNVKSVVSYAATHGLPVIVEGGTQRWIQQTTDRLRRAGITVLTEEEDYELRKLDRYWIARCEVGDRIEFEPQAGTLLWGRIIAKGCRYLEVFPDGWAGATYVAGREVRTLVVKGPQ